VHVDVAFASRAFARSLAYRANALLAIFGNLVIILIQVAIWRAVLGAGTVAGVGAREMVTYAILSTGLTGLLLYESTMQSVDRRLRSGDIAVDLIRPVSYPRYLAADALGQAAFHGAFAIAPTLVVAGLVFGLEAPASPIHLAAFVVAVGLSLTVSFVFGYLSALLAFWFLTTLHFEWSLGAFFKVFGGAFLPLWFFPPGLAEVAGWLPFRYLNFVPVAIYLGQVPVPELAGTLLVGLAWAAALLGLAGWLWSRSVRRLVIQGG
jgi:viologen exporter family transport system permease protein